MIEIIKNFIYDLKDLVIMVAIVSILVFSVTWKINDTLNINATENEPIVHITTPPAETTTPVASATTTTSTTTTTTSTTLAQEIVFEVHSGEYGQTIAANLVAVGLISSVDEFLARAAELGVDKSLREGVYTLKRSDDLDTILRLLSGGSR